MSMFIDIIDLPNGPKRFEKKYFSSKNILKKYFSKKLLYYRTLRNKNKTKSAPLQSKKWSFYTFE